MNNKSQTFRKLTKAQLSKLPEERAVEYAEEVGKRMGLILEKAKKELNELAKLFNKQANIELQLQDKSQLK